MKTRFLHMAPLFVAASSFALVSGLPAAPAALLVVFVVAAVVRRRAPLDNATQRLMAVVVGMLVIAGVRAADFTVTSGGMRSFAYGVGLAPLCIAAARQLVKVPEGGRRVDVGLALLTLLSCGSARPGPLYVGLVVLFVAATVVGARADDPDRVPLTSVSRRGVLVGVLVLAVAGAGASAFAAASLPAARYVETRFNQMMTDRWASKMGFTDSVRFGRVTRLLASKTVVMRLTGPRVTHLRGVALDHYDDERWSRSERESMAEVAVPIVKPDGADVVEVRPLRVDGERLFTPLDARQISTGSGRVKADSMGVLRHLPSERAPTFWFRVGPRDAIPVADARDADLQIPGRLRGPLTALSSEWIGGRQGREAALAAIEAKLLSGDYKYSTNYTRRTRADAVAEFLFSAKQGHCEVFASAMVLLARSAGIPARLVVGYRVGERNPVFSHWVVRESNAHAWVEAQLSDGSWKTFDPTPMSDLPQDLEHDEQGADVVGETLMTMWSRAEDWLSERSVFELGGAAALGLIAFATLRLRRQRKAAGADVVPTLDFTPPLEAFAKLEVKLAGKGFARAPGQTIERWAATLPEAIASAVLRYAAHRYGGLVEAPDVVRDLEHAAGAVDGLPSR